MFLKYKLPFSAELTYIINLSPTNGSISGIGWPQLFLFFLICHSCIPDAFVVSLSFLLVPKYNISPLGLMCGSKSHVAAVEKKANSGSVH